MQSCPVSAITGGVPVAEVLAAPAGSRYTAQQTAFADAVSAVTVALFKVSADGQGGTLCTGTIVHPRVVLTAAHCVLDGREVSRRITVLFEGGTSRRQALDVVVHPAFLKGTRDRAARPGAQSSQQSRMEVDISALPNDLALVLLHRPIPEVHDVVAPVPPGFRDSRNATKLIAGYGSIDTSRSIKRLALYFAELQGNSKGDEGAISGGHEIVMLSRYQNGARVNVCSGDSGGPILVFDPTTARMHQLAVTSAGDEHCREGAIFAPIDSQRAVLRTMFDVLMQGEVGAEHNPF
jgi:hypothetical protein